MCPYFISFFHFEGGQDVFVQLGQVQSLIFPTTVIVMLYDKLGSIMDCVITTCRGHPCWEGPRGFHSREGYEY